MNINKLAPRGSLVVVKLIREQVSVGGLHIPVTASKDDSYRTGTVLDKGPDTVEVNIGDKVVIPNYLGMEVKIQDQDCVVLYEDDVLAVLLNETP